MFRHVLMFFGAVVLTLAAGTTSAQVKGCPAGTAIQGIDFSTRRLVCVPVSGALKVMDAANQQVGLLLGGDLLVRNVGNEWFSLSFTKLGLLTGGFVNYYYESEDCTGQPYLLDFGELPRSATPIINGTYVT